jgi:hypothetical protein
MPQVTMADDAKPTDVKSAAAKRSTGQDYKIRDVKLTTDGALRGQLVDSSGAPIANSPVRLLGRDGVAAASTSTDEHGAFKVQGLRGGLYLVDATKARSMIRAWSTDTAPPAASDGMLMVGDGRTVRGRVQDFGGISDGVFRWDEFGGMVALPLIIGGSIAAQHAKQEGRSDAS